MNSKNHLKGFFIDRDSEYFVLRYHVSLTLAEFSFCYAKLVVNLRD